MVSDVPGYTKVLLLHFVLLLLLQGEGHLVDGLLHLRLA